MRCRLGAASQVLIQNSTMPLAGSGSSKHGVMDSILDVKPGCGTHPMQSLTVMYS